MGAEQSRLSSALNTIYTTRENFLAAASRISDADTAFDAAALVRSQILQQTASQVLAQASLQPQIALSLLRG